MKSGLGKIFLKFLYALTMSFLLLIQIKCKFSNKNNMVSAWRNFRNIFPRPLFIIIFSPEMLKFHPYSILTVDTRVEFVIYSVLSICVIVCCCCFGFVELMVVEGCYLHSIAYTVFRTDIETYSLDKESPNKVSLKSLLP